MKVKLQKTVIVVLEIVNYLSSYFFRFCCNVQENFFILDYNILMSIDYFSFFHAKRLDTFIENCFETSGLHLVLLVRYAYCKFRKKRDFKHGKRLWRSHCEFLIHRRN